MEIVKGNDEHLKYPRRKTRTINNTTFEINEPTETRSKTMSKIKGSNTSIEKILEDKLALKKINYCRPEHLIEPVEGSPDFVIPKYRIAIFCDGDFWHGYNVASSKTNSNSEFWEAKIKRNQQRDKEVNDILDKKGWKIFRFWEHEIRQDGDLCTQKIQDYIDNIKKKHNEKKHTFTFVDLFSGIGGFRVALEDVGGKCLGFSEIDKEAITVYKRNYIEADTDEFELGSVTQLSKLPFKVDLIVGGVPCQSWSVAGKMRGFEDPRGRLWYDTLRIVEQNRPKAFIFENVKGLHDPRNKESLDFLLESFEKLKYKVNVSLLNSYDFGLPQNRERIFIVGIRKDIKDLDPFSFPKPLDHLAKLTNFIDDIQIDGIKQKALFEPKELFGDKIPFSRNKFQTLTSLNDFFVFCDTRNGHSTIHSWDIIKTSEFEKEICMAIMKNRRKKIYGSSDGNPIPLKSLKELIPNLTSTDLQKLVDKKILRITESGYEFVNSKNSAGINGIYRVYLPEANIFSTLTATGTKDMVSLIQIEASSTSEYKKKFIQEVFKKKKFRSITPREAGRLQGFPNWFIIHSNDKVAHKQFGNAVSAPVIVHLSKSLLATNIFCDDNKRTHRNSKQV